MIEPTQSINISTEVATKNIHLAESLTGQELPDFTDFFREKQIKFAWSYAEMPRVDLDLVMHHLSIAPRAKPVKQKLRKMNPQVTLLVKAELKKLLDVGFIQLLDYAEWISNIVTMSKPDKSIKICTNFRDLNKACPKDYFPLPSIDTIMNLTRAHAMLSLIDGFLG